MATTCPSCRSACEDSAAFCQACGTALAPSGRPAAASDALTCEPALAPATPLSGSPAVSSRPTTSSVGSARFVPGALLAGRYRIAGLLGRGGMGEVYRADDLTLQQPVALKFLPSDLVAHQDRLDRFRAEVSVARQVSHPNVCRVYDIGEADGLVFLSMEYIDGEDLGSLLRRIGRLPQDKGLEIARQLCAGLAAAHDRGVVHRDLKPGNVMIDGRGQARIADFGLAAVAESGLESRGARGSEAAAVAGTPAYMAPEQFDGRPATIASDIYALGLILYEIFTGKRAFNANTVGELAAQHRERTPSSMTALVSELDPAIERTIARCLDKDPAARPVSALTVAASLPGGDPLAAALARGETPSPELVAAAGSVGTVKPAYALAALAFVLAGLVALVVLAGYVDVARQVPLPKSPDVLRNDASIIANTLGYVNPPVDSSSGFTQSQYLEQVRREPWWDRRAHLASNQPAAILFWYRQSPSTLQASSLGSNSRVGSDDPPETEPGMLRIDLDSEGRLRSFLAVPPEGDVHAAPPQAPDWSVAFRLADFDMTRFAQVQSEWVPPVYADTRAAWTGAYPRRPDVHIRIEAAAAHGRLVCFHVVHAWNAPADGRPRPSSEGWFMRSFAPFLFLSVLLLAAVLTMRNLRLGRGDRRGAQKLANMLFAVMVLMGILGADLHATAGYLFGVLLLAVAQALLIAGCAWVGYIALEPYVRRRWPQTIISWTRLMAGRWRDPLVGWHILAGLITGVALELGTHVSEMKGRGQMGQALGIWFLDGSRFTVAWLLGVLSRSILLGISVLLLLFVLSLVVRRRWIAVLLIALFFAGDAMTVGGGSLIAGASAVVAVSVLVGTLLRYGLITIVVAVVTTNTISSFPVTFDLSQWYAPASYLVLALFVGLAVFGAWTSGNLGEALPKMLGEHQ